MKVDLDLYTDKTYLAILGSIGKWADILRGRIKDHGSSNCPLCRLYIHRRNFSMCEGVNGVCPVVLYVKNGNKGCNGTPYNAYSDYDEQGVALEMYYFLIEVKEWYIVQKSNNL